jgi:hypothetical protein
MSTNIRTGNFPIFKVEVFEDWGDMFLRNVGKYPKICRVMSEKTTHTIFKAMIT